ncbi:hypothetical protein TRFO_28140 [Tritrichomonas foetus]|uniref:Prominin n=1 Tax=Tritrichomonas foetus TaxID=1144522 RepID=A0A1J4K3M0_9EUKA|nr:hypothetical protein TRFO_28140 [Tritrichomonas foetus]|eukprot:OHT04326.1 hypothetical protein TRFO_28140 [Tritrichomonas foetus]
MRNDYFYYSEIFNNMFLGSFILVTTIQAAYIDKKSPQGSVFPWIKALGHFRKLKTKILGITSNTEELNLDSIISESVLSVIPFQNLTQVLYDNLGQLTKNSSETNAAAHVLGTENNLDEFEKFVGNDTVQKITNYISVQTANEAIGSLWSYLNTNITLVVFFLLALLAFLVQMFGCCCCCKAVDHHIPGLFMRGCIMISFALLLLAAIFMFLCVISLNSINEVIEKLDTEIIGDIAQQLHSDLVTIFSDSLNARGSAYAIFSPPLHSLQDYIIQLGKSMIILSNAIQKNVTTLNNSFHETFSEIKSILNDQIEVNRLLKIAQNDAINAKILELDFDMEDSINHLEKSFEKISNYKIIIATYSLFSDTAYSEIDNVLDTILYLKDNQMSIFIDNVGKLGLKEKKRYDSGFRLILQNYEDNFILIRAMVIVFGVVIIMNISIYYFCWGGFCSASRCCAASSSIYPLIWSIVMFIGAFLSTYFGSLLLTVGYGLEKYLDNAIREVASSFVPDNSLIFPTIYLGPYTHNLVNEKFDLTWHVLPNNLILFEKLNIASISLPLVEILNLEDSFNFKMLGLLFNSKFLEIYDTYTIPNDMILLLNEAITTLQDKSQICQDLYDLQTT